MAGVILSTVSADVGSLKATASAMGVRAAIKAARVAMPYPDVKAAPVRRFVSIACTAEVKHAEADFWRLAHDLQAATCFDPRDEIGAATSCYLPHEAKAGAALVWLSHLQTHDSDRHGPWARWARWDRTAKAAWLKRRRYLLTGLIRVANEYRAERAKIGGAA